MGGLTFLKRKLASAKPPCFEVLNDEMTPEWLDDNGMSFYWWNDIIMMGWQWNEFLHWNDPWMIKYGLNEGRMRKKKSRAFALLQKFESFHPHSSHSKSFQDEKIVIPASFQSFWGHSVSEWPWNDDKVISKWLKMTGMVRDGGDQNILHQKFSPFHHHSIIHQSFISF